MNTFIRHYFYGSCDLSCPICQEEDREEEERISKMTPAEIRAELIENGCDPDRLIERVKALIAAHKEAAHRHQEGK